MKEVSFWALHILSMSQASGLPHTGSRKLHHLPGECQFWLVVEVGNKKIRCGGKKKIKCFFAP